MSFEVIIDQVRSFASRIQIPIRPLTLLVGENSSGKSTFLACVAAAHGLRTGFSLPEFNTPPYNLGTYETIATYKGGRYGRARDFTVGFTSLIDGRDILWAKGQVKARLTVSATFANHKGNPRLHSLLIESARLKVRADYTDEEIQIGMSWFPQPGVEKIFKSSQPRRSFRADTHPAYLIQEALFLATRNESSSGERGSPEKPASPKFHMELSHELDLAMSYPFRVTNSLAPIRSRPKRTYDTLKEDFDAEGDHIPTMLSRWFTDEPSNELERLRSSLRGFGKASGLFKDIGVKRLGKGVADPFQIQVNVAGPSVNLSDIGYGVSQVLPVVVQSVLRKDATTLLIQQPEVHLHPRAQAALGTFFAQIAEDERKFVVETHSDYLVDRVRQEVAKRTIKPEDVQILFFDKPGLETTIHQLTLDENGNVENAPEEYRSFFMEESMNLLTRTDG